MAASKSELWAQLAAAVKIIDQTNAFANVNTPNLLSLVETLQAAFEGDHIAATQAALSGYRSTYSGLLTQYGLLSAILLELAKIGYSSVETDIINALEDIYDGMISGVETVKYRNITRGAVSPWASNTGTGTVYRLTVDKNNKALEHAGPIVGNLKILVTADKSSGRSAGNEEASLYGNGITKVDEIYLGTTTNKTERLNAKRSSDSSILTNASFETVSGSGGSFAASGWTLSSALNFASETTDIFRPAPGGLTGKSLRFASNGYIQQNIGTRTIDVKKPVMFVVRLKRESSCDGTVTIQLGTKTASVALSAQSGWFDLCLGVGTDYYGWYDSYKEDNGGEGPRVVVTLASRTTGTLLVDEILLIQPTEFDGAWYLLTAGATDYLKDDYFTFTDSAAETGRIQYWIARLFGVYLPHTSGTPTYADA